MRAKRRLIELLNEQKQAIIHRAMTRGLDPNVRFKPSGIDWLGDVPAHWDVAPLHRHVEVVDCKHVTVPFFDEGVLLASVAEVQRFELDLPQAKRTSRPYFEMLIHGGRKLRPGDIIYCRNTSVGAAAYVNTDEGLAMGQDVCLLRPETNNGRFLNYQLNSSLMRQQLNILLVGATIQRVNMADIRSLTLLVPPRQEQDQIAAFLTILWLRLLTPLIGSTMKSAWYANTAPV